jgi:hypothetical protein
MKTLADSQQRLRRVGRALPAALAVAGALALGLIAYRAAGGTSAAAADSKTSATTATSTKIRLRLGARTLTATVVDSRTSRDFLSLLPLTVRMSDLLGREKAASLPRALAKGGKRTHTYRYGAIVYWAPGPDVAVMYRRSGPAIPDPGDVVLATLDSGVPAFNMPGTLRVKFERVR